jgi:2-polyprenyl-6-methoxyphenol hydroxylase-like FAD-dependent oxidoreductase
MRAGVLQLSRWGVLDRIRAEGTPAVRTTTFHYAEEALEIAIKPRDGVDALYAPRRTVLDQALVESAREAGAEVRHGVRVVDLVRDADGRVRGVVVDEPGRGHVHIQAGLVIGADGAHSRVAKLVGAEAEREGRHASAVIYGYAPAAPGDGYHWYYCPGVSVGAIPTNDDLMCLFVAITPERFREELPHGLESLYRRALAEGALQRPELAQAPIVGTLSPFMGRRAFLRRPWGPGWALVGDAGYFKDPITAHGITDALLDAESLARAVAEGGEGALERYHAERNARAIEFLELTDAIASFTWDLDTVKEHHLQLSRLMAVETRAVGQAAVTGHVAAA